MDYNDFINLFFKKEFNYECYYYKYLLLNKKILSFLKNEVDYVFFNFLLNTELNKKKEVLAFYDLYNKGIKKDELSIIYRYYEKNVLDLNDIKDLDFFNKLYDKLIEKYERNLKINIKENNVVIRKNIIKFFEKNYNFFIDYFDYYINNFYMFNDIDLKGVDLEGDLSFFLVLGIDDVRSNIICDNNRNLKSLYGLPRYVKGVSCCDTGIEKIGLNYKVEIEDNFYCSDNENLKSLEGSPEIVYGDFICNNNSNLKTLKGCPSYVGGKFICNTCRLEELGIERNVEVGGFECNFDGRLKTLRGCPNKINGSFDCRFCDLEELGMQEGVRIEYNFDCSHNENLKSLRGCPSYVGGNFVCNFCNLKRIDLDANIKIEGDLVCLKGNNVTREQVEEYIRKNNIKIGGGIK